MPIPASFICIFTLFEVGSSVTYFEGECKEGHTIVTTIIGMVRKDKDMSLNDSNHDNGCVTTALLLAAGTGSRLYPL